MKRVLITLAGVAFVVAAISIARANSGDDTPKAEPTSATNRDLVKQQTKAQAEELTKAQAHLAEKMAQDTRAQGQQTLIVTMREESPGQVWVPGRVDGKPACVTPPKRDPTFVEVTAGQDGPTLKSETAPLEAALLKNGACEAVLELFVPETRRYRVTIGGAGKASFKPVDVQNADHPVTVTFVG